ncbi:hypothetical protein [Kitasatospora sp. NPDC047058]|uniref:hypothetical protein n=1 Tax=Kitasatospora sp. NPDC047058 TaxID=3155620 RepID=UPI00340752DA
MPTIYRPAARTRHYVSTTRTAARTGGQLVDHIAVERAINGEPVTGLNEAEQHLAAVHMLRLDVPMAEIARRVGAETKQVVRWRDQQDTPKNHRGHATGRTNARTHTAR